MRSLLSFLLLCPTVMILSTVALRSASTRRAYHIKDSRGGRRLLEIFASPEEVQPTMLSRSEITSLFPTSIPYTAEDKRCIEERQLDRTVNGMFAVEALKCKHGYPRAFVRSSITYPAHLYEDDATDKTPGMSSSEYPDKMQVSSGMLRLSCPHLVKAIDDLEDNGGIGIVNRQLIASQKDDELAESLRDSFLAVNRAWADIRACTMSDNDIKVAESYLGVEGAKNMINSGIIGVTPNKVDDVKCLHAHLGDYLLRGENEIGELIVKMLNEKNVDINGCDNCWQQCSANISKDESEWWYMSRKNKEKLRTTRDRKREKRINGSGV